MGRVDRDSFKNVDVIVLTAVARLPERILYAGEVWSASEDFHGCFSFIVISPDGQKTRHSHFCPKYTKLNCCKNFVKFDV